MGKDDWYFIVGTLIGIAGLLGVPWKEIFGKAKTAMRGPKREMVMAVALLGSLAMSSVGWYKAKHSLPDSLTLNMTIYDPPYPASMQVVSHKTFEDQDVPLDGYIYENCTFKNTCFMYGGGAFGLHNSTVTGQWKVCVSDQRLKNDRSLLDALRLSVRRSTDRTIIAPR
jgi:hypothetical protein